MIGKKSTFYNFTIVMYDYTIVRVITKSNLSELQCKVCNFVYSRTWVRQL